jgi:hypothetical protein
VSAADDQAARWARREPLLVLLSRMQRGVLLPQERGLLREAVETELRDGDGARPVALREAADLAHAEGTRLYDDMGRHAAEGAWAVRDRLRTLANTTTEEPTT